MKNSGKVLIGFLALFGVIIFLGGCGMESGFEEEMERTYNLSEVEAVVLTAEGFHDAETMIPRAFLELRGAEVTLVSHQTGEIEAYNSDHTLDIEYTVEDVGIEDYDVLIIPGGHAPGELREQEEVVEFVADYAETGKPVAAICHGPQLLVDAGLLEGRKATSFADVGDEIEEAGGDYLDQHVVVDDNLITSRLPGDIPDFSLEIARALVK